jgi:hypothetical protein
MAGFSEQFDWSRQFTPEISGILTQTFLPRVREATFLEDVNEATDIVLEGDNKRVAVRMRTHRYLNYSGEFTLRSRRGDGITELDKIVQGWASHIFYGFANESGTAVEHWFVGCLTSFRGWYGNSLIQMGQGLKPGVAKDNGPNDSGFRAFKLVDMPEGFVVSTSRSHPGLPPKQLALAYA